VIPFLKLSVAPDRFRPFGVSYRKAPVRTVEHWKNTFGREKAIYRDDYSAFRRMAIRAGSRLCQFILSALAKAGPKISGKRDASRFGNVATDVHCSLEDGGKAIAATTSR